ncbi:hypothetical protein [Desulfovibrio litoralis]|uniref:DUF697 domain-containing protein n=1 Tax=Desulfovibrio litoralis DSM 11393 TaxID=1121455 RepID=A0A1M7SLE2_9BACT|nr:hypothetical protein [Desulfovibrio litoralis]SHN59285.1 protein of unknown function [Desulfovibrio litoralis DSM 11393]
MNIKKIFNLASYLIIILLVLFLFSIIKDLSELSELAFNGSGRFVFLGLLSLVGLGFIYLLYPLVFSNKKIILKSNYNAQEKETIRNALNLGLNTNPILKNKFFLQSVKINESAPEQSLIAQTTQDEFIIINKQKVPLSLCYEQLDKEAKKEIMSMSKKVFVGTALSQNGKLDSVIVFFALCRTVWLTAKIYNHKLHPLELFNLYRNVAYSTFLAFSFEELDLGAEISGSLLELGRAISPALGASQVPFVGNALKKLTGSCIEGAANSFLLIRVGLITRNLYKQHLNLEELPSRGAVFKESGSWLKELSNETVQTIIKKIKDNIFKNNKQAQDKEIPIDNNQKEFQNNESSNDASKKKSLLNKLSQKPTQLLQITKTHAQKNFNLIKASSVSLIKSSKNKIKKLSSKTKK